MNDIMNQPDLAGYDRILVAFSGGKDSLACLLRLLDLGVYRAGFGRVSCQFCIFGNSNQCASARRISPERFEKVANYEDKFGVTIHRNETFRQRADKGVPYASSQSDIDACKSNEFNEPVILAQGQWKMPLGAFAESCGPV